MKRNLVTDSAAQRSQAKRTLTRGLRGKSNQQIECRGLQHAWEVTVKTQLVKSNGKGAQSLLVTEFGCSRGCGVLRRDRLAVRKSTNGTWTVTERLLPIYNRPADYGIKGAGRGRTPATAVWTEWVRRNAASL